MSSSRNANTAAVGEWKKAMVLGVPAGADVGGEGTCYMFQTKDDQTIYAGHGEVAAEARRLNLKKRDNISIDVLASAPDPNQVKNVRREEPEAKNGVAGISPAAA